jgi:hypothetical protein
MMADTQFSALPEIEGWVNEPTCLVNRWLAREPGLYQAACDAARDSVDALREFTDSLVLGETPPFGPTTDLLTWALTYVDFDRLAEVLRRTQ